MGLMAAVNPRTGSCMADVLDPAYAPSQVEDKLLFEEKQKYLYAVFEQKLQTDKGKALVREYKVTSDAQAVMQHSLITIPSRLRPRWISPNLWSTLQLSRLVMVVGVGWLHPLF